MDEAARRRLVEDHAGLVRRLAGHVHAVAGGAMALEDLVGYGYQGLVEAAQRYDPGRGHRFVTFAHHRVRGAMYDGMRQMSRLPRGMLDRVSAMARIERHLDSVAWRGGAARGGDCGPSGALRRLHDGLRATAAIYAAGIEGGAGRCESAVTPEEAASRAQLSARVRALVAELPARERHVIERCYFEDASMAEAGAELGLSRSWTSRLHARAVARLRARLCRRDHRPGAQPSSVEPRRRARPRPGAQRADPRSRQPGSARDRGSSGRGTGGRGSVR